VSSSHKGPQIFSYRGFQIHYAVYGQGDPVICLHGLNLDHRIFAGKGMRELLSAKMIVALDLPGCGSSDFIPDADVEEIGAVITKAAEELGLSHFELCGFCLGGIFALDYAIRNQDKVTKLYLIETMIHLPWWMNLCSTPVFGGLYDRLSHNPLCLSVLDLLPALKGLAKIQSLTLTNTIWNNEVNSFYLGMMKEYQKIDHIQRSRGVACETVLIYSEGSYRNIKMTNHQLHTAIRKSTLHRFQPGGHFTMASKYF